MVILVIFLVGGLSIPENLPADLVWRLQRNVKRNKLNLVFDRNPKFTNFAALTVVVAQLVRALDCGSRGRGFEPHHPPQKKVISRRDGLFLFYRRSLPGFPFMEIMAKWMLIFTKSDNITGY